MPKATTCSTRARARCGMWRRLRSGSSDPPKHVMAGLTPPSLSQTAMRRGYVHILASGKNGTFYIGVTNNLSLRVWTHKEGRASAFTKRYGVSRLVWYEEYPTVPQAIQRETSLKRWKREWKIALIEQVNPAWEDLSAGLV